MSLPLLHSPAEVIRQLIVDLGVGNDPPSPEWPAYASFGPATGDDLIAVLDGRSKGFGRTMADGERQQHYGYRILIRSSTHAAGYARASALQNLLDQVSQRTVVVEGTPYLVHSVNRQDEVDPSGKDRPSSARSLFSLTAHSWLYRVT